MSRPVAPDTIYIRSWDIPNHVVNTDLERMGTYTDPQTVFEYKLVRVLKISRPQVVVEEVKE